MARNQRYESSLTIQYTVASSDGFGGLSNSAPLAVVTGYDCSVWKPNLRQIALLRTEYGMSDDADAVSVSGAYNISIREGYQFVYLGDTYIIRNVTHIRGAGNLFVATHLVAERKA